MSTDSHNRSLVRWLANDWIVAGLVFVASLAIYLLTMSPSVVVDDGGEMQMLSYTLGVAHPTGYPLMLMLGWLFGHLPIGADFAWRISLMGALASALSMSLLYVTARELRAVADDRRRGGPVAGFGAANLDARHGDRGLPAGQRVHVAGLYGCCCVGGVA